MRVPCVVLMVVAMPVVLLAQKQSQKGSGYDNAARATVLHTANLYITADSAAPPVSTITPGHEIVVGLRNGPWVNVFANTDQQAEDDPDGKPEFEEPAVNARPSSGWIRDKGIVGPETPHGDVLLYGAAAELEAKAEQPNGPKDAAPEAHRLYARVVDYFPNSPLAAEAAFHAADIRWQLDKTDISTLPSAHEQEAYLRPQVYEGELKWVMKNYANTPQEAMAAFDLIDNKLCGDWQGLAKCPEMETQLYLKYADRYKDGPKSAEALYDAAYRQGVVVTMYKLDENPKLSAMAAKSCQAIADRLLREYPKSPYAARAESIAFRVAQGIPVYGNDRD
jgi:outer membrane protein assembly factor BamD (BamD/ComL family)